MPAVRKRHGAVSLVLAVSAIVGCGDSDPASPPAATTVEITPGVVSLEVGGTEQLSARVLDQNGQPMSGQSVTWSSSDTSRLVIDGTGLARGRRTGSTSIRASVGGAHQVVPATIRAPEIRLETAAAVTSRIGPAGGTITARAANGTSYSLTVPAGALFESTDITVTPVTSIGSSTTAAALQSGVKLQPSGLRFLAPATVTIDLPAGVSPAPDQIGFHFSDDGEELVRYPMFVSGRRLQFLLAHFSGVGSAAGSFGSMLGPGSVQSQQAVAGIAAAIAASDVTAITAAYRAWYLSPVRPLLSAAASEADAVIAWNEFRLWHNFRGHPALAAFRPAIEAALSSEIAEADNLAAVVVRTAINDASNRCLANQSVAAAVRVLVWMKTAELAALPNRAAFGIDRTTVLQNLCAKTAVEASLLHLPLRPGERDELDVTAHLAFGGSGFIPADPFQFETTLTGTVDDGTRSDAVDGFTGVVRFVTPVDTLPVTIHTEACFTYDVLGEIIPVCDEETTTLNPTRLLHFDDFSNPTDSVNAATSPSGEKYYGELTSNAFTFTKGGSPGSFTDGIGDHTSLVLEFDIYIVDSWNGNGGQGSSASPDIIEMTADGVLLLRTTFSNKPRDAQAYPGSHPGSSNPAGTGALGINSLGYPPGIDFFGDTVYRIRLEFPHTDASVTIRIGPNQTSPGNEVWGIDNFRLSLGR